MPKKFAGENSKASAAKARKTAAKDAETAKRQKDLEDQLWKDDDKHVARKQQRKEEQEKKKQQQLEKKAESKALYEQEMQTLQKNTSTKQPQSKVTRAQIQAEAEKRNAAAAALATPKKPEITHDKIPIEENINRIMVDGVEARNIDEAIAVLSLKEEEGDRHPEKRLKAAFTAFEEANLPQIKAENPNLRLSQQKQILRKLWIKSPENPLNQRLSLSKQ